MYSLPTIDGRVLLGTMLRGNAAAYYVQSVIGEGGQGWVYKASYDDAEGYPVVVKVLRPDSATRDALQRFQREAEILKRLSQQNPSPFIVRFFDHGEVALPLPLGTDPRARVHLPFTVMEYVHGESLQAVVARQRGQGLSLRRVRRILREIQKALEIVHAQGMIHRDLKPSNVLLANEAGHEVAKVTDFGIAKIADLRATATQGLAGMSLSYAPPEQYEPGNARVGPWTDVFSFGAVVFELLAGTEAFPAHHGNPLEALRAIATGARPKLGARIASLPLGIADRVDLVARLDEILVRAFDPEPRARPQSIAAIWEPIDAILREAEGRPGEASARVAVAETPSPAGPRGPVVFGGTMPPPVIAASATTNPSTHASSPAPSARTQPHLPSFEQSEQAHFQQRGGEQRAAIVSEHRTWSFRVAALGVPGARVRDVVFDLELGFATTLGNAGLVRWSALGWSTIALPVGLRVDELRGIAKIEGGLVAVGIAGLVAIGREGATATADASPAAPLWEVRRYADDVVFEAVAVDPSGTRILAVGARHGRAIAVEIAPRGIVRSFEFPDLPTFRAVAWLDPKTAFVCGDAGALARIDDAGATRLGWERTGDLLAIAATVAPQPAVYAVGTGGHALAAFATPGTRPALEPVQTTRDLFGLSIAEGGIAWACSGQARLVRRDASGTWRRVPLDPTPPTDLVRIAASSERVIAVGIDATIVEGRPLR